MQGVRLEVLVETNTCVFCAYLVQSFNEAAPFSDVFCRFLACSASGVWNLSGTGLKRSDISLYIYIDALPYFVRLACNLHI